MADKTAILYRMVLPDHVCPFGVRAKQMLTENGYDVDDRLLQTRQEVDEFEAKQRVDTTPLVIIDGQVVGGSDDLERFLQAG
ncbi:glutathione S-transferase N-terminal domain-containing protein [Glacieibacterium sp.]|uniref:glutathione S-transferase N-terminal domain-containing protein n=1 Tax=Glacieibacterium sp. TaxID=2860237 RepID=UPI003B00D36B